MGQQKMDKPEKLATEGTLDEHKQSKNTTQYVLDTTISMTIFGNDDNHYYIEKSRNRLQFQQYTSFWFSMYTHSRKRKFQI